MNTAGKFIAIIATSFAAISGQAQQLTDVFPELKNDIKTIYIPPLGQAATAELGNSMLSSYWASSGQALGVAEQIDCEFSYMPGKLRYAKGTRLSVVKENKDGWLMRPDTLYFVVGGNVKTTDMQRIFVFVPKSPPHTADVINETLFNTESAKCPIKVGYVNTASTGVDDFKRELVYTGISKGVISLTYREYLRDMARPAFNQDLKFDLNEGKTIGFKGARFNVIEASNIEIKYEVLKPFDR